MESRDRILQAAARVYAESGFRGATTRRIAAEAGVNEVTLFRIFGSKSALLGEVLQAGAVHVPVALLPETPVAPERELTQWCAAHLAHLRAGRAIVRKMMSELEERPEVVPCAGTGPTRAARELRGYLARLRRHRLADGGGADGAAAVAMLMGALFADAMGRDVMVDVFPQPEAAAPRQYARLFLRAVGMHADPRPARPRGRRVATSDGDAPRHPAAAGPAGNGRPATRRRVPAGDRRNPPSTPASRGHP